MIHTLLCMNFGVSLLTTHAFTERSRVRPSYSSVTGLFVQPLVCDYNKKPSDIHITGPLVTGVFPYQ